MWRIKDLKIETFIWNLVLMLTVSSGKLLTPSLDFPVYLYSFYELLWAPYEIIHTKHCETTVIWKYWLLSISSISLLQWFFKAWSGGPEGFLKPFFEGPWSQMVFMIISKMWIALHSHSLTSIEWGFPESTCHVMMSLF